MRTLGIVRRLEGVPGPGGKDCYYCGQPLRRNRTGDVCWQCSDLPLVDPLVHKARQPLSESERIAAVTTGRRER